MRKALLVLLLIPVALAAQLDRMKDFAIVTVVTGYNASATSITLSSGQGSRLLSPATDGAFYLVWYNATDYPDVSSDPNREVVRVTARSGDILTVIRGQAGTTATTKNTAGKTYRMLQTILSVNWRAAVDTSQKKLDNPGVQPANRVMASPAASAGGIFPRPLDPADIPFSWDSTTTRQKVGQQIGDSLIYMVTNNSFILRDSSGSIVNSSMSQSGTTITQQGPFILSGTGAYYRLAGLTTAQRNALTPVNGTLIYNTTTRQAEVYQNGAWAGWGTGTGGADANSVAGRLVDSSGRSMQPGNLTGLFFDPDSFGGQHEYYRVFKLDTSQAGLWETRWQIIVLDSATGRWLLVPALPTDTAGFGVARGNRSYVLYVTMDGKFGVKLDSLTSSGAGEANTASNLAGSGVGVYRQKVGLDLQFKRISGLWGLLVSDGTDSVKVAIDTSAGKVGTKSDLELRLPKADSTFASAQGYMSNWRSSLIAMPYVIDSTGLSLYGTRWDRGWFRMSTDSVLVDSLHGVIVGIANGDTVTLRVKWGLSRALASDSLPDLKIYSGTTAAALGGGSKVIPPKRWVWVAVVERDGNPPDVELYLSGRRKW